MYVKWVKITSLLVDKCSNDVITMKKTYLISERRMTV